MIATPLLYLFVLALLSTTLYLIEQRSHWRFFRYIPAVVILYALSMLLASFGVFKHNEAITHIYKLAKTNLLPAMLFLILLQVEIKDFFKLGKRLVSAYLLAFFSLVVAFVVVVEAFDFGADIRAAFGALAGSWMGGTANMIAVGSALGVSEEAFGNAMVVDSVNYTIWVAFLLFCIPLAHRFNHFTKSEGSEHVLFKVGCACEMGAKKYWLLVILADTVSLLSQILSTQISFINTTTTVVLIASLLGIAGSFTKLREIGGSSELASTMLYLLIALIGSQATVASFTNLGMYILAGFLILVLHATLMVIGAKLFKLDLYSISVASLSNIGGVASAPILAAAYDKKLVGVGVLMAIIGYLVGTLGGLCVGYMLQWL